MRHFSMAASGLVTAVGLFLAGCAGSDGTATTDTSAPAAGTAAESDHSGQGDHAEHADHAEHSGDDAMAKMKAGLAKLSEEDRVSAEKQHMCPVSGEMLGTMGTPIKVTLKGQDVWLCCDGCRDKAEADPDAVLAKVGQ
ncbi:hypothetical protein GC176_23695 [bacterium]|nr:hypothetical protein [bacterium]